jgi:murine toxin
MASITIPSISSLTISSIYDELKKYGAEGKGTYTKSDGNNIVEIIDTPWMWGVPFEEKDTIVKKGADAKDKINKIIQFIIQKAEHNIDIVSLAPPTGEFLNTIVAGLQQRFASEHNITLVRFLFGWLPGGEDTVKKFRDLFEDRFSDRYGNQKLELYIGRLHGGDKSGVLNPWNHAKIVTADGRYALVGGHNLWPHNYADYPPVHDISLFIRGDGAEAAQNFTNFLWTIPGTKGGIKGRGRSKWTRYYKYDFIDGKFPAEGEWESTTASCAAPVAGPVDDYVGVQEYTSKNVTVLGVGRFYEKDSDIHNHAGVKHSMGYPSPSEQVKELVIKAATNRLYICQQDLLFLGAKSVKKTKVVKWIVEALTTNKSLVVKIVISSINAKSQDGSQYSWGSGALGTYNTLVEEIGVANKSMLDRLHVAPFCFTNVPISRDGAGHEWKDSEKYRLKKAQFSTLIPIPRILTSVGKYPEPANHAKFYMAVDTSGRAIYYVGSDNLYPHDLFEFGYLIGDKAANIQMYDKYWTQVWKYSGLNCVCVNCRTTAHSALVDSLFEYEDSIPKMGPGKLFRKASNESAKGVENIKTFLKGEVNADDCNTLFEQLIGTQKSVSVPEVGKTFKAILIKNFAKVKPSDRTFNGAWTYR